jgi:hypothetical protein
MGVTGALFSKSTTVIRGQEQQTPNAPTSIAILETVWMHFKSAPYAFEAFATRIFQMHDPVSRLISRIRHREFGVLVTTSVSVVRPMRKFGETDIPLSFSVGRI